MFGWVCLQVLSILEMGILNSCVIQILVVFISWLATNVCPNLVIMTLSTPGKAIRVSMFCYTEQRPHNCGSALESRSFPLFRNFKKLEGDLKMEKVEILAHAILMESVHSEHAVAGWNGRPTLQYQRYHTYVILEGIDMNYVAAFIYGASFHL